MNTRSQRLSSALPATMLILFAMHFICLGAIMYFFMGGSVDDTLGHTLQTIQLGGIALATAALLTGAVFFRTRGGLRGLYDYAPRWLLFALFVVYCVVAVGELSFVVLSRYVSTTGNTALHVSLICLLMAPTAFTTLLAIWQHTVNGTPFDKARW
ncbi:MAG: hypothetical protein AAFO81_10620 [Pseudomonadota bacterium]